MNQTDRPTCTRGTPVHVCERASKASRSHIPMPARITFWRQAVSANKLYDMQRPLLQNCHKLGRETLPTAFIRRLQDPSGDPLHRTGAGAVLHLAIGKMLERHIIEVQQALTGDAEYWASGLREIWKSMPSHVLVPSKWDGLELLKAANNVSSSIVR